MEKMGNTSVTWLYEGLVLKEGKLQTCVKSTLVTVCVNLATFKPMEVPQKYRDLFSKFSVS